MKIGLDARLINRGGIGRYISEIITHLLRQDRENQYIVYSPSSESWMESFKDMDRAGKVQFETLNGSGFGLQGQLHLIHLLRKHKVDLFHVTYDFGVPPIQVCPIVLTVHDAWFGQRAFFRSFAKYCYYQIMARQGVRSAAKIITVSHFVKNELVRNFPNIERKIEVIYNGVDSRFRPIENTERVNAIRSRYGIHGPYILSIGTFEAKKNFSRLVGAFSLLLAKGKQVKLVMVGRHSFAFQQVKDIAIRLGVGSSVFFIEHVPDDDLPSLYRGAEVFVLPSLHEGFGLSVLEAMACGVPVIVSKAGALPEIAGDCAILVDPHIETDLMNAIWAVLSDESVKTQLIRKGLDRARSFSWEVASERVFAIYQSILE